MRENHRITDAIDTSAFGFKVVARAPAPEAYEACSLKEAKMILHYMGIAAIYGRTRQGTLNMPDELPVNIMVDYDAMFNAIEMTDRESGFGAIEVGSHGVGRVIVEAKGLKNGFLLKEFAAWVTKQRAGLMQWRDLFEKLIVEDLADSRLPQTFDSLCSLAGIK